MSEQNSCAESTYERLFRAIAPLLRNFLIYKYKDVERSEDMVQEAFLTLWKNCEKVLPGALLAVLVKFKKKRPSLTTLEDTDLPPVTLLVAAYNEEDIIEDKIKNSLALNYPKEKLNIAFVTDGSNDGTNQIIEKYPETT